LSVILLVEECRNNNRKAQMALYSQYCEGMFIVAQRYMKDTAAAEDAMQEAFVKAFSKLNQFEGDVTFGAWLKRIVINTCLDTIKSKKIETESIDDSVIDLVQEDNNWDVGDDVTYSEIIMVINELPEKYRLVVQLFLLEGYDHNEISGILCISENSSRTNLHRGKSILKENLKHLRYGTGH